MMKNITVFCGSSSGTKESYTINAIYTGRALAEMNIGLVYGGAKVGLMGAVADATLKAGGKVTGVLPHFLSTKEIAHETLTELILVDSMHERKTKMHELSDGFIALPGGFGTLEELFEILTWAQLGLHTKPIGILNTDGYYDAMVRFIEIMVNEGFLKEIHKNMLIVKDNIDELLVAMNNYVAPPVEKWIRKETT